MKPHFSSHLVTTALGLLLAHFFIGGACAQSSAFTYQGRLDRGGAPANGIFDLRFALYDTASAGSQQGNALTNSTVAVSNGAFAVSLDFGPGIFSGPDRWLEIGVRTNGATPFSVLSPRQAITRAPYSLHALNATTAASANAVMAANIVGALAPSQLPAGVVTNGASGVNLAGSFSGSVTSTNFQGDASSLTNLLDAQPRLPWALLNKLENGRLAKVLWVGDSLVTDSFRTLQTLAFKTNLLVRYGTNGVFGGGYHQYAGLEISTSQARTAGIFNDSTLWLSYLNILTNGHGHTVSAYYGDGFFTGDHVGLTYLVTNAYYTGTLTLRLVSDANVTNTIATIACAGSPRGMVTTNFTVPPGRYKTLVTASDGDVAFDSSIGIWSANAPGVRYGYLGYGGQNNFLANPSWVVAVAGYAPDLLLIEDANDQRITNTFKFVQALQARLPFMDVVFIQVPTSVDDYTGTGLATINKEVRKLIQSFAQTNACTTFFDTYSFLGGHHGFSILTNSADGIPIYDDSIHPSVNNPAFANILGRRLFEQLGFQYPTAAPDAFAPGISNTYNGVFIGNAGRLTNATWVLTNALNTWSGLNVFAKNIAVGGAQGNFVVISNSGIQITSQNSDSQFGLKSRQVSDGSVFRHWVDTNTLVWQASSDGDGRLMIRNHGGLLQIFSGATFNWNTYTPSLGRATEPYWLFTQGTTLVTNNVPPPNAATPGGAFLWNSNATVYLLTSLPDSTTWAATNKLGGP